MVRYSVIYVLHPDKTKPEVVSNSQYTKLYHLYSQYSLERTYSQVHRLPRVESMPPNLGPLQLTKFHQYNYIRSSSLIPSPMFCILTKPNRKWYQTLTTTILVHFRLKRKHFTFSGKLFDSKRSSCYMSSHHRIGKIPRLGGFLLLSQRVDCWDEGVLYSIYLPRKST